MKFVCSRFLVFISFFALSVGLAHSKSSWRPSDLPNPQQDPQRVCGRSKQSAICDPDGILALSERDELDGLINFIAEGTNGFDLAQCADRYEGYQLAVLVINSMNPSYHRFSDSSQRAKQFAKDIHDKWGVGDAQCHNGVVIFVSIDDKQIYISTGKGTKLVLSDSKVSTVLSKMRPLMREEQYGKALISAVNLIGKILSGKNLPEDELSAGDVGFLSFFGLIFFSCFCFGSAQSARKRKKYRKCKAALKRIDDDTVSARNGTFKAQSCPICLENFENGKEESKSDNDDEVPLVEQKRSEDDARVALPCGHIFFKKCIMEWTEGANSDNRSLCPVCRQPVDGGELYIERPTDYSGFEEERNFRIMRAHDLYPDYITYNMVRNYQRDSSITMQNHSDFASLDPVVLAEARSAGQGGSTFSFGGSSSAGGGGGGSSW